MVIFGWLIYVNDLYIGVVVYCFVFDGGEMVGRLVGIFNGLFIVGGSLLGGIFFWMFGLVL